MTPDDPRHGTEAGFVAHKRSSVAPCEPCKLARFRSEKARRTIRINGSVKVPALGSQRRVQALQALGWSRDIIAAEIGYADGGSIAYLMRAETMLPATAAKIAEVYDRLSMRVPTGQGATRARTWAKRHGYAPPLAWDDIDDPAARPSGTSEPAGRKQYLDHAAIERRINGDRSVRVTADEAREIVRRLYRRGFGAKWIDDNLGIKAERYLKWSEFQSEIGGAA